MKKVLISGGSGFIGTNLIEFLDRKNIVQLLSIDKKEPKINRHRSFWKQVDLCDKDTLKKTILDFQPNYVIHLAARTDLCGKELIDYDANMLGVSNLLDVLDLIPNLQRAIFASSMYVCTPGYIPKSFEDYAPHTLYGESKVETEKRIKEEFYKLKYCSTVVYMVPRA